jgi:hypothetical protein
VSNSKGSRGPDPARVNLGEPGEVRYWCEMCRCTEWDLRAAVNAVGARADNVHSYLKKRETARLLWREGVR